MGLVLIWLGLQITAGLSKVKATILMVLFIILTIGFGAVKGIPKKNNSDVYVTKRRNAAIIFIIAAFFL